MGCPSTAGAGDTTGVALIEIYDASEVAAPSQKVINLSARAVAGPDDDSLIAGFHISGSVPKRVLVRAVGPSLSTLFGVPGTLGDPQLRIVQSADQTVVATNDNWATGADAAQISAAAGPVGAFQLAGSSLDAALLVYLRPGSYSAVVSGSGTARGVALVEIYEVP